MLISMAATTLVIFHLSSFTLRQTSCLSLSWRYTSIAASPPSSTCTASSFSSPPLSSSSHDHFAVVHRPQVLVVKASPDTPPHSVCSPVRLIPQIWGERMVGEGGKRAVSHLVGVFLMSPHAQECWQPVFQSSMSSTQEKTTCRSAVYGCYNWDRPQGFDL